MVPTCTRALVLLALAACGRTSASPAPTPPGSEPAKTTAPIEASRAGKAFGEACVEDPECTGGVCFHKRLKVPDAGRETRNAGPEPVEHDGYCSMRCDRDGDCPVPPTRGRCGARGMCKRPE